MRTHPLLFIVLLLLWQSMNPDVLAQSDELLIFSSTGNNKISRNSRSISEIAGDKFLPGDILYIKNGSVTLINRTQKRVTISDNGSHTYATVKSKINKAEASITTRYFIFVWEQMNKDIKKINSPGGIVRGERPELHPNDSAKVISDTVLFFIRNPMSAEYKISIKTTEYKLLKNYTVKDSILMVATSEISDTLPNELSWEVSAPFQRPVRRLLYFPDREEKEQLMAGFNHAYSEFIQQEGVLRMALIYEYLRQNRLYVYPY